MFTGLYSTQIKLFSKYLHNLSYKLPILTETLKDLGYSTVCYTENPWINRFFRLTRGFDHIFRNARKTFEILENNKAASFSDSILNRIDFILDKGLYIKSISRLWRKIKIRLKYFIEMIIKSISWKNWLFESKNTLDILEKYYIFLKNNIEKKPIYLFFNIMASHYPYIPIQKALDYCEFDIHDFKYIKNFLINARRTFFNINIKSKYLSEKQTKILKKLYDSSVYYSDMIIGKIFSILSRLKLLQNTYVIITSDHGEHLSDQKEYCFYGHGVDQSAYEPLIRVPLIIYNTNFKKRIISNQVELIDLFHTILHLTGISNDRNKYLNPEKSILYQIDNNTTPHYIYGEHLKVRREMHMIVNNHRKHIKKDQIPKIIYDLYFLRSSRYKYINFQNQIEEFYDLVNDPFEQINIVDQNDENYNEMKSYLFNFRKKIKNVDSLQYLISEREKNILDKTINKLKINF